MKRALIVLLAAMSAIAAIAQTSRWETSIDVNRMLIEARALGPDGQPLLGLGREDFRVLIDGVEVMIEAVEWTATGMPETPEASERAAGDETAMSVPEGAEPGRLVVFLFQTDFHHSRLPGLVRMSHKAAAFLQTLEAEDRVAVLSFGSHLALQSDFTTDHERLRDQLTAPALLRESASIERAAGDSIVAGFDRIAARRAASPEAALLVIARALRELPGSKTLVMFGWGLGRFSGRGGVRMDDAYAPAREELQAARVSVFTLDITDADYHSLEVGLQQVAADTGGFYARTHLFPDLAMKQLERSMIGHYVLVVDRGALAPGWRRLDVRLIGRRGTVLAKAGFVHETGRPQGDP